MVLDAETTPIDMIIGDKDDIKKSHSAKLFELKAEIGEIIMLGGLIIVQHIRRSKMKNISPSQKYLEKILYSAYCEINLKILILKDLGLE